MSHFCDLLPWPENPLERLVVVELLIRRRVQPATAETLAENFDRATRADLEQVLQMLLILGHVACDGALYRPLRQ